MASLTVEAVLGDIFEIGLPGIASVRAARPEHVSMSVGRDDGAVEAVWKAYKGRSRHASTAEVGEKFDWYQQGVAPIVQLIGHGQPGSFDTGDGAHGWSMPRQLWAGGKAYWQEHMARLSKGRPGGFSTGERRLFKHSGGLQLIGCCVAAEDSGLQLLQELSEVTNRTVWGFTGLIHARGSAVIYERGQRWIRQDPDGPRTIREQPRPLAKTLLRTETLREAGMDAGMEAEDVASIHVDRKGPVPGQATLPPETAREVFDLLFHSKSFPLVGTPLAQATHEFTIQYRSQPAKRGVVYAGRLVVVGETLCFFARPDTIHALDRLMRG